EQLYRAICAGSAEEHGDFRQPRRASSIQFSRCNIMLGGAAGVVLVGGGILGFSKLGRGSPRETSIGVIPFRNLSGDSAEQYFSDGIAEVLRATFSQNSDLAVAA